MHRVDLPDKQFVGWSVRYQRCRKYVSRFFADEAYRGCDKAHASALRFASERTQDIGELLALLRRFSVRKTSRSGLPGVARLVRRLPDRGAFWVAYWDDASGRKVQRKFSVAVHGEEVAWELAIETRLNATKAHRKRLAELLGPPAGSRARRPLKARTST